MNFPVPNNNAAVTHMDFNSLFGVNERFLDNNRNLNLENSDDREFLEFFFRVKLQKSNKKQQLSGHTIRAYRYDAQTLFEFLHQYSLSLKGIGFPEVQAYNMYVTEKYAIRSAIRKLDFFKRLLKFGVQTHFYKSDLTAWVEKPSVIKGHYSSKSIEDINNNKAAKLRELSQDEARIIVTLFERTVLNVKRNQTFFDLLVSRNRLIGQLLFGTGMRAAEVISLNLGSFRKVSDGQIYIDVIGKGRKQRSIPIFEETTKLLNTYLDAVIEKYGYLPEDTPLLFSPVGINKAENITRMSYEMLYKIVKQAINISKKNPDISPHWFRHTYVTMLLGENVPVAVVMDLVGHSNIATTNIYLEKISENKKHEHLKGLNLGL